MWMIREDDMKSALKTLSLGAYEQFRRFQEKMGSVSMSSEKRSGMGLEIKTHQKIAN